MAINPRTKNTVEIDCPYDVGDIYMTKSERKPWDRWPGTTWSQIEGRFMLGATKDGEYENNAQGGETEHQLTEAEMPNHTHYYYIDDTSGYPQMDFVQWAFGFPGGKWNQVYSQTNQAFKRLGMVSTSTGGSQPHNNMPPYNVCYIYERLT